MDVDHTWMWRLNPQHGAVMEPEEYIDSVRLRQGCAGAAPDPVNLCPVLPASPDPWTQAQPTRPAARWAKPRAATTRSPHWCTLRLSPETARPRLRFLGSSLALISDPPMSSPPPSATPTLPPTSRFDAQQAGPDCTQTRHEAPLAYCGPDLSSLLRQNISYTPIVWSACGRPRPETLTVVRSLSKSIARKRNFVSAEVVCQKLHASITLEIWNRSARQIRACWPLVPVVGPLPPVGFWSLSCWCPCFPWPVLSLRRAIVSALSRFACPSHVTCAAHGSA